MRVLLASGWKPRRTIQFMGYAAEEEGLRGSAAIAQRYAKEGRNVVGVMQLDMTNYPGPSADIVLMTDYSSNPQNRFIARLAGAYLPTLRVGQDVCGYACSDHASWTANGYAASIPAEALYDEGSPYLHTTKDTLARSNNNAEHAVKFARLALAYAVELGSDGPVAKAARTGQ
jgi:bacterial leucyl aminopeptidase